MKLWSKLMGFKVLRYILWEYQQRGNELQILMILYNVPKHLNFSETIQS